MNLNVISAWLSALISRTGGAVRAIAPYLVRR
jgi:hypothetical protein